jgi:hypothetical protein
MVINTIVEMYFKEVNDFAKAKACKKHTVLTENSLQVEIPIPTKTRHPFLNMAFRTWKLLQEMDMF